MKTKKEITSISRERSDDGSWLWVVTVYDREKCEWQDLLFYGTHPKKELISILRSVCKFEVPESVVQSFS